MNNEPGEWTKEQQKQITEVFLGLRKTLQVNEIPINIAGSALMALTAAYTAISQESDDYMIDQFRKCLFDARTRLHGINQNPQ